MAERAGATTYVALEIELVENPDSAASARIVAVAATLIGPAYKGEFVVGAVPSTV
jgi:hypothetical protein